MSEQLQLESAQLSEGGIKPINEDAVYSLIPSAPHLLTYKGAVFALADGVSSAEAGKFASHRATADFVTDYFRTPDSWPVGRSAEQTLSAINLQLYQRSHAFTNETKGYLCTFSALILKSHTAYCVHLGDSRIYLWRAGALRQLTQDHCVNISDQKAYLTRALGMDNHVSPDITELALTPGDRFLLCSDGLHDFISDEELAGQLAQPLKADALVQSLKALALARGSDDNISLIITDVLSLPDEDLQAYTQRLTRLAFPPHFSPGDRLDHYEIVQELFASKRSLVYLVRDLNDQQNYALKAPSPNYSDAPNYIERFIREEWIGHRIEHPNVVRVVRPIEQKTYLYYVMDYVPGQPLDQWLKQNGQIKPRRAIQIVDQIADGLAAFHRCAAVHQDLKPQNIMIDADDQVKIIDFGSTFVAGLEEIFIPFARESVLGTATHSDPQYLQGKNSGIQGDIYSLASICYEIFSGGALPYGEGISECQTLADYYKLHYRSLHQLNPRIPLWFDRALEKGVHFDLEQRYFTLSEFLRDIHSPNPDFLRDEIKQTANGHGLLFWKLMSGFWFITLILVTYLFSRQ